MDPLSFLIQLSPTSFPSFMYLIIVFSPYISSAISFPFLNNITNKPHIASYVCMCQISPTVERCITDRYVTGPADLVPIDTKIHMYTCTGVAHSNPVTKHDEKMCDDQFIFENEKRSIEDTWARLPGSFLQNCRNTRGTFGSIHSPRRLWINPAKTTIWVNETTTNTITWIFIVNS